LKLLAIDVGTGTQDILLLDTAQTVENAVKMVVPSPTRMVAGRIEEASRQGKALLVTGVNMGGGPSTGALKQHIALGLRAYATPQAATTFDDDLNVVRSWGVTIVSDDEASRLSDVARVETRDLDLETIRKALAAFDVSPHFDGLAVAVLDHGEAPPGVSDRLFRFQHFRRVVESDNRILAFAYLPAELPSYLTRMRSVAESARGEDCPLVLLDTGPAAALGSLEDAQVARHQADGVGLVNLGNMHALGFYLQGERILGLFEHHTGLLDGPALESHITRFLQGRLTHEEVFEHHGHGCLMLDTAPRPKDVFLAATGPQRVKFLKTGLRPYFATPFGDMMVAGCFGLIRAFAHKVPAWGEEIERALAQRV